MDDFIDISVSISPDMPIWPGGFGVSINLLSDKSKGDFATGSRLDFDIHSGTHIDSPLHHIPGGKTTNEIDLQLLCGKCFVLDCGSSKTITAGFLENKKNQLKSYSRILFKTRNSKLWLNPNHDFNKEYCALEANAAQWIVDNNINLVGIDYHSIQLFSDPPLTHEILLSKEVVILETINLFEVNEGVYELLCLPMKIDGVEGATCRALLKK